jgi:hypothetical protein
VSELVSLVSVLVVGSVVFFDGAVLRNLADDEDVVVKPSAIATNTMAVGIVRPARCNFRMFITGGPKLGRSVGCRKSCELSRRLRSANRLPSALDRVAA